MLNRNLLIAFALVVFFHSCESTDTELPIEDNQDFVNAYLEKRIGFNGFASDSIYYNLENDKIVSSSGIITPNSSGTITVSSEYVYDEDMLSELSQYENDVLTFRRSFEYDEEGNITEYLDFNSADDPSNTYYRRSIVTEANDTIYMESWLGQTPSSTNNLFAECKFVFNDNDDILYYEFLPILNSSVDYTTTFDIDSNGNILSEVFTRSFGIFGTGTNTYSKHYTYDLNSVNTLHEINKNTFGKKNYHIHTYSGTLTSSGYWDIRAMNVSFNSISSYTTNYEEPLLFTHEITNETGVNGFSTVNTYKHFLLNEFYYDVIIDYVFN